VTCPNTCPFNHQNSGGCYAEQGPLLLHWRKVTEGLRGVALNDFVSLIAKLPEGQLWRHNQAGDLPHHNGEIDADSVNKIVDANKGKRGFTYTHHLPSVGENSEVIKQANQKGFTVNLSADNLEHADELSDWDIAPVTVVLPYTVEGNADIRTAKGRRVVVCPATYKEGITCASCKLCQSAKSDRPIVGFPAHGTAKKRASRVAEGLQQKEAA
jgi:hypothetical protein